MRLININKALRPGPYIVPEDDCPIEEHYVDADIPRYAALSHRWLPQELLLRHIEQKPIDAYLHVQKFRDSATKILEACRVAQRYLPTVSHLWVDTCCIDKTNAVELDEAIRSMFNWYNRAEMCLVYFADVSDPARLSRSVWFQRGWTLQELLAPPECLFFDQQWSFLGTRQQLAPTLSKATGIDQDHLVHFSALSDRICAATKLSWAALRQTTRPEDMAYSLVGLLGVSSMTVRYGEGSQQAVQRLQEEVIRAGQDESIFAWHSSTPHVGGMIAPSLDCFLDAGCLQLRPREYLYRGPYDVVNGAIRFPVPSSLVGGPRIDASFQARRRANASRGIMVPLYIWKFDGESWWAINIKIALVNERWRRIDCNKRFLTPTAAWLTEPGSTLKISTPLIVANT